MLVLLFRQTQSTNQAGLHLPKPQILPLNLPPKPMGNGGGSMTDLVSVASNAVQSYQRALGTVSNNIANVSTDGYSQPSMWSLAANPVAKVGTVYLGTGVIG
jgi:hypothetical protein